MKPIDQHLSVLKKNSKKEIEKKEIHTKRSKKRVIPNVGLIFIS